MTMEKKVLANLSIKEFVYALIKGNHYTELVYDEDYKVDVELEKFTDFNKLDVLDYLEAKTAHFDSERVALLKAEMEKARKEAEFELSSDRYKYLDEDKNDYYGFTMEKLNATFTETPNSKPSKKEKKRRGRPSKPFSSLMMDDNDGRKYNRIKALIKGKRGKSLALLILACMRKGWITKPTFSQIEKEFGDVGDQSGYNRYVNNNYLISKEEIDDMIIALD